MTDTTTPEDGGNVVDFARRTGRTGFNLTPTLTLDPPVIAPPPATPPATPNAVLDGARRSPLDIVNALPDPGILQPPVAPPAPGMAPDTFRSEPAGDMTGPRLGALSLAACLAVAVAALRGTHTVLSTWWQTRQAREAETAPLREARLKHQLAMQNIADKGAQQHAKTNKVPSSSEFGRKTLGSRGSKGGGGSSLFGSGSSGSGAGRRKNSNGSGSGSGSGLGSGSGTKRGPKKTPNTNRGPGGGGTGRSGNGKHNALKKPKTPKSPHRPTQGAGTGLLKKSRTNTDTPTKKDHDSKNRPTNGGRRTPLTDALTNGTRKAADRRLKQRRKNGLDKPALWTSDTRTNRKSPKNAKTLKDRKDRTGKDTSARKPGTDTKNSRVRKDGSDMKLGPTAWRDLRKAANRRWKRRQKRDGRTTPPLWRDKAANTRKAKDGSATSPNANTKAKPGGKPTGAARPKTSNGRSQWWKRARDYARTHGRPGNFFDTDDTTGSRGPGPDAGPGTGPGAGGTRRRGTPFQNAGHATSSSATTYTVESEHVPGSRAKQWEPSAVTPSPSALPRTGPAALDAAPTPHTARPGTTRPKEPIAMPPAPAPARPDPRIVKAKKQAARAAVRTVGRQMNAQHETEITLDDACDAADHLTSDAFKTHDQSHKLTANARSLRDAWLVLAEDCANDNNLIGDLFASAAISFAESMELVARMSEEMRDSSLEAAEKSETAGNELNDAYRPITQATADAGLTVPSAPVHNRT